MSKKKIKKIDPLDAPCGCEREHVRSFRETAEDFVNKKYQGDGVAGKSFSPDESQKLIYELEVHQVELEMQNRELLRIHEELEKSREWYMDLFDIAPVGYITLDDKNLIIEANLTAASILGVRRNALCRQSLTRFIHEDDLDIFHTRQKALFDSGSKQIYELRMKRNDVSEFWAHIETVLAYGENNILTCRAVMSDITEHRTIQEERKKYEEQNLRSQKLESLGILAGGIAHNFNNLLSGIFGYIELAQKKAKDEAVSRYLSEALNMSERARALTGQLLTFSRGGAPVKKCGNLFPLIKDSVQFALSGTDIACRFNVQENFTQCYFDVNQMCQVIEDIILNARQAMPDGGVIEVTADNIFLNNNEIAPLPEGDYNRITIKDSGIGMTPEVLSKILDPFFTTRDTGYGLGLATSYSIISKHGGTMRVESEPDKGTKVFIYLPSAKETVSVPEKKYEPEHRGSGTMIIMDDEEYIISSLSGMLMSMGYDVIHMEKGEELISFLNNDHSGINDITGIILDLIIPGGMGGKTAVTEIRKIVPDIPVFAISGYSSDPVMVNPCEFGFTASISKPFLMRELSDMLNKNLKQSHVIL